jgi:hypothetical protein
MRLALLGCDESWKSFLRDLPPEHELVAVYEAAEHDLPLNALLPQVQRNEQWESLLIRDDIDLILVASPTQLKVQEEGFDPQARRVDQLKKLAQAGRSLLVSHPGAELLDAYEIEMLRREGGGCLQPWFPGLNHPAWDELPRTAAVQINWERRVPTRSRAEVFAALARDLILIERIVGKLKRVTALSGSTANSEPLQSLSSLTVQFEAADQSLVRWSLASGNALFAYRVVLSEGPHPWELEAPADLNEPWLLREQGTTATGEFGDWDDATVTLANFERVKRTAAEKDETWLAACRSLETLTAVEKSLQRSRTIELSQSEQTEEHAFKGVMASTGCMLLLMILFAIFIVALVEGLQLPLRNSTIWRLWPVALVVALAGFLGLQFLQAVIQKSPER